MNDKIERVRSVAPGIINLGGNQIECHVLSDGRRVLGTTQIQGILSASKNRHLDRMIERIHAKSGNIQARPSLEPIEFVRPDGRTAAFGYEGTSFVDVCLMYQQVLVVGRLHPKQMQIAAMACAFVAACSKVGIIALIDEATGYQDVRKHGELAEIYRRFFVEKATSWELVFTQELCEALCRLYRKDIVQNPRWQAGVNGRIYDIVFGKKVMSELRRRNPAMHGYRVWKNHQWLDPEVRATFRHKLEVVLLLAKTSSYVPQFWDRMRATFQGLPMQLEMQPTDPRAA